MPDTDSLLLRLPGEEAWELWLREGKKGWRRADKDDGTKGGVFAIECLAVDSAPFWLVGGGDTETNMEATASLRWEALGQETDGDGRNWLYWRVAEEEAGVLAATMALAKEGASESWEGFDPDTFELSAALVPIPPGECALWKELGRYVMAFTRGEKLLHVAALNARTLDAQAAWEIRDVALALEVRGFLPKMKAFRVFTAADETFMGTLKEALGVRVRQQPKPVPQMPAEPSGLLPPQVARHRIDQLQRARMMRLIGLVLTAYFTFFAAWAGWLWLRDHRVERQIAALAIQEPALQSVRDAQLRWMALEQATDPNQTPVEIFHQIVSLLPPEGIQLQKFTLTADKLTVSGVASSTNHALKFTADLQENESLKRYTWSLPPANILEDNRASFVADGTLNGGTTDEQQ